MLFRSEADWDIIRQVKEAVQIPVIGNGDVTSPERAKQLVQQTGCDGIMIGRAVRGNPWLFAQIRAYMDEGKLIEKPSNAEVKATILRHAKLQLQYKGDYIGIREMRKHLSWYTVGYPNSSKLRQSINNMETFEELMASVEMIFG